MNVIVIEDEIHSREKLENYLHRYDPTITIVLSTGTFRDAVNSLVNSPADLVLSDIKILDGNIFHLLADTPIVCPFIFISAYDNYAFNALENHGFGYLLKPYTFVQFSQAMDTYVKLRTKISGSNIRLTDALSLLGQQEYRERIITKSGKGEVSILKVGKIKLIEIAQGVLFAHSDTGKKQMIKETLTMHKMESMLDPKMFFRINKSQIINIDFIATYEAYGKNKLAIKLMDTEQRIFITSVNKTFLFKNWIQK